MPAVIEEVLQRLHAVGIKLKPSKCVLFCRSLVWCGHHISEKGVGVNPEFTAAVLGMQAPDNAGQLMQFLASCNWVRGKIPAYAELVAPLQQLLQRAMQGEKKRTAKAAAKIALVEVGWSEQHRSCFDAIKHALANAVTLAHLDDDKAVCLFPDASECFWGAILTQVPEAMLTSDIPVEDWEHEPLAFLSGAFKGASLRWGIPDKEGYAIKESCARLAHLLVRRKGFNVFTDHRNLKYIFNPVGVVSAVSKPQADRLERWAVFLRSFDYAITHIAGEDNNWGDMLSRWAAGTAEHLQARREGEEAEGTQGEGIAGPPQPTFREKAKAMNLRVRRDRILTGDAHTEERKQKEPRPSLMEEGWPQVEEVLLAQHEAAASASDGGRQWHLPGTG